MSNFKCQISNKYFEIGNWKLEIGNSRALHERGLTLIELLIVIAIIGVLGGALLTIVNPIEQVSKSNDARRKADLAQVQRALELYYNDRGTYPPSSATYRIQVGTTTYNWGSAWSPYISGLPRDPSSSQSYVYYSPPSSSGQTYYIYASLQRGARDQQSCNNGNACTSLSTAGFPPATACGGTCNFGVTSPNVSP